MILLLLTPIVIVSILVIVLFELLAEVESTEQTIPTPSRHIELGISFSEREQIDEQEQPIEQKGEQNQNATEKKQVCIVTITQKLKQIVEVKNVK